MLYTGTEESSLLKARDKIPKSILNVYKTINKPRIIQNSFHIPITSSAQDPE
jgi:hypothetical protein